MIVRLPYGERLMDLAAPDDATVLLPRQTAPLVAPADAVERALATPLGCAPLERLARRARSAAVVVSDVTRPVPNGVILPPVLAALERGGVARERITIVIGTGLHRTSRDDERERILGRDLLTSYAVIDHDARDPSTQLLMQLAVDGDGVMLNRAYLEADVRVVTGFVEPHLFAGYSGGGKGVLPGIAGAREIMANHAAAMIGHPRATWCVTEGNPIFEQMRDVALKTAPTFTVQVTLDERKRLTGVFAGDLVAAHDAAIAQAARQALRPIPHLFDVVVVTNMGYPADLSLYQSVKGMSVAAQACATGGAILLVAECREGLGGPEFSAMLRSEASPSALLARIEESAETVHDQWQAQVQAMVQARCDVWLHSSLDRGATESAHLRYAADLNDAFAEIVATMRADLGREPSVCVMPFGQLAVPFLEAASGP